MTNSKPTKAEAIETLIASHAVLSREAGRLSPVAGGYLWTAIDCISDEIDRLVADDLPIHEIYIPITNAFRAETDQGQRFAGILSDTALLFARVAAITRATADVQKLMPMSWLLFQNTAVRVVI